jgi:glucuronoarabinoxylan endo-1,4-beta-xylanase
LALKNDSSNAGTVTAVPATFSSQRFMRHWAELSIGLAIVFAVASASAALVKLEAESGVLGADYAITNFGGVTFIAIRSNGTNAFPASAARVASFTVNFPTNGTYDLYARVRVGPGSFNDDSFFHANGFGSKNPTLDTDWIFFNNLSTGGFTNPTDVVTGNGSAGNNVWKWINFSEFSNGAGETPIQFVVPSNSLTQTFQIGAREDGFDVDAIVFGSANLDFTVTNLDAGTDGTAPVTAAATSSVNFNDVRQRIDGFGASSAWRGNWNSTVADLFFSTNTGIGLSLLRTRIAPGGSTVENSIMQMARDRGARVWSSPWTPAPAAQFKSNGATNGGAFIGNSVNYQAYANQLATYVVNMKNQFNVTLYAISIQNEPDANVTTYESCNWTAQQIHDFIPYLSTALTSNNVGATRIMLPESQNWTDPQGLRLTAMNDAAVAPLVSIIANHNYVPDNNNGDQSTPAAVNSFGKALWETEVSTFSPFDGGITNGIYWARRIHGFLTVAQANAWHYWWLSATSGDTSNSGLATPGDVPAKRAYVLGQFSRFVRPDYYRIGVITNLGISQVSAYKDPVSSKFAIVAINPGGNLIDQTINLTNFGVVGTVTPWITSASLSLASQAAVTVSNSTIRYSLPPMSVVTFVGQAASNSAPTLAAVNDRTINAGVTLVLTNGATDPNVPPQTLTFSLLNAPANATLNSSNGVFTWRPFVSQANTTNAVIVRVSDGGSPALADTNNFTVTVNPLNPPVFNSINVAAGEVHLSVNGDTGPDYTLLTSTNLFNWELLLTTNSPTLPFTFVIPGGNESQRYYQIQLGP